LSLPPATGTLPPAPAPFVLPPWTEGASVRPRLPRPTLRSSWRNLLFFALTVVSVYETGLLQFPSNAHAGLQMALALLGILGAHEMGHYLACRYYRVDATLPFFIPSPWFPAGALWAPLSFVGTFGAVIRIKDRIPHRRALFDIGIAGPLAGFVTLLPVLYVGLRQTQWTPIAGTADSVSLGLPLLFQWAAALLLTAPGENMAPALSPLVLAAWFGMFVTALNLMPVGQLDGGHVVHALMPHRSHWVSRAALGLTLLLLWHRPSWLLWTILLLAFGRKPHPPTRDEQEPVGRGRVAVGLAGLAVLVLCFTPSPIEFTWHQFADGMIELGGAIAALVTSR
jgi:membrane-associated protease RseP (regulator of RpoE activity)